MTRWTSIFQPFKYLNTYDLTYDKFNILRNSPPEDTIYTFYGHMVYNYHKPIWLDGVKDLDTKVLRIGIDSKTGKIVSRTTIYITKVS